MSVYRQSDRQTQLKSDFIICPLLCYSNGADKKLWRLQCCPVSSPRSLLTGQQCVRVFVNVTWCDPRPTLQLSKCTKRRGVMSEATRQEAVKQEAVRDQVRLLQAQAAEEVKANEAGTCQCLVWSVYSLTRLRAKIARRTERHYLNWTELTRFIL